VGCGPDMVRPWVTGMIYPLGRVEILASIMKDIASDGARLTHMGRMARLTAQDYSVSSAVQGVLHALQATVGAKEAVCMQ